MSTARPQPRRARRRAAFTLLELLVAMMLVAILSLSLYASLRISFRSKAAADAAVEPPRTAAMTLDIVGRALQSAVQPGVLAQQFEGLDTTDDQGHPGDDVQFYGTVDSPLHQYANGDLKYLELTTMTAPNGDHVLVQKTIRNLLTQNANPNPDVEVICRGVAGFNCRYFNGTDWLDTWDSTQLDNTIPAAIEVTLTLLRPAGPNATDGTRTTNYVRVFPIPCSTAAQDSQVNPNALEGLP